MYSDKDERLLLDIEKLIKQTITRGTLHGFVAPASRGRDAAGGRQSGRKFGRESGRPPRDASREFMRDGSRDAAAPRDAERGPRRDVDAGRGASRPPRTGPEPGSRRERVDPWFLKPYEPTNSPRTNDNDGLTAPAKPGKQKLAFLLGGGPKQVC